MSGTEEADPSRLIDARIDALGHCRGALPAPVRKLVRAAVAANPARGG